MEKTLKLYQLIDGASEPFPNIELQAELYSFQYDAKRMGDAPSITGTIMFPLCLDNLWSENVFDAIINRATILKEEEEVITAFCPQCGCKVDAEDRFCRKCGGKLR